jgi:hypothetical protein
MEAVENLSNMTTSFGAKYSTNTKTLENKQEKDTANMDEDMAILEEMIEVEKVEERSKLETKAESAKVESHSNMEDTTKMESKVEDSSNTDELEEVIECALRLQQKIGRLPGRKRLMEEAG